MTIWLYLRELLEYLTETREMDLSYWDFQKRANGTAFLRSFSCCRILFVLRLSSQDVLVGLCCSLSIYTCSSFADVGCLISPGSMQIELYVFIIFGNNLCKSIQIWISWYNEKHYLQLKYMTYRNCIWNFFLSLTCIFFYSPE